MITIDLKDQAIEEVFAKNLQPKLDSFGKRFNVETVLSVLEAPEHKIDTWLGVNNQELQGIETKEKLIEVLRKKQKYAKELRNRARSQEERFESYEISVDLFACFLESKPSEGATTIPTMDDCDNWIVGIKQSLEEIDLIFLRKARDLILNNEAKKKA